MAKLPSSPTKEPLPDEAPLPPSFNLTQYGITVADIRRNLSPAMGITEPQATFSPCFGGPFLVWQPTKYAELLASKMREHKANAWLVNTGWSGGSYGVGSRMKLKLTRAIINAVHSGKLSHVDTVRDSGFGFDVPTSCPGVDSEILIPRNTWNDKAAYDAAAQRLAGLFRSNFEKYADGASPEVRAAGPAGR